jgi:hypothetical protein
MKLHYTKYKKKYERYILSIVANEMKENGIKKINRNTKIDYLFTRINNEYGWKMQQEGKQKVIAEWLSGLALNIPYIHNDVVNLAIKMGSIDKNPSNKLQNRVVKNYFNFMANMLLSIKPNERVHGHTFFYNSAHALSDTENHRVIKPCKVAKND